MKVRVKGRESEAFNVTVGVHQGSVFSLPLFIIRLELCLQNSERCDHGTALGRLSCSDCRNKGIAKRKLIKYGDGNKGSKSKCW